MHAVFILCAVIAGSLQASDQEKAQARTSSSRNAEVEGPHLPEGAGRALILEACLQCHDLKNIVSQRKTAAGWKRTIHEMIWRGAPLMPGEDETLASYLAASFGPGSSTPEELRRTIAPSESETSNWMRSLPQGEGRPLVIQTCGRCHGLQIIISQRKTLTAWRRTVMEMVRLGTAVMPAEAETIARYLAASFRPD